MDDFQYSAEDVGVVTGFQVTRDTFNPYGVNPDWHFDSVSVNCCISSNKSGLEVIFLVHLQSFASKIFFD